MKAQLFSDVRGETNSMGDGKNIYRTEDVPVMKPGKRRIGGILRRVDTKDAWKCLQEGI